jgi:hypothetical protein
VRNIPFLLISGCFRLDYLHQQEVRFTEELRAQVLPLAPPPIGLSADAPEAEVPKVDEKNIANYDNIFDTSRETNDNFFDKHRDTFERMKLERSSMMDVSMGESITTPSKQTKSTMNSRLSSSSYTFLSPTGRAG